MKVANDLLKLFRAVAQAQEIKPEALPLKAQGEVLAGEPAIESMKVVDLLKSTS